jgi:hypothetical protein
MARGPKPKTERNKAPSNVQVDGEGAGGNIVVTDVSREGELLATITVFDPNIAPELRDNVVVVSDSRFEVRDGGLYVAEGAHFSVGELIRLEILVHDADNPKLKITEKVNIVVGRGPIATLDGDELLINYAGSYEISETDGGGWLVTSGGRSLALSAEQVAGIATIVTEGANLLTLDGSAVHGRQLVIDGQANETVNVTGVSFTESAAGVSVGSNVDLSGLRTDTHFLVNGSVTEAFKAVWNYLDDAYAYLQGLYGNDLMFGLNGYTENTTLPGGMVILGHTTNGAAALAVNKAVTALDIAYADYLADGGSPNDLVDFIAKTNALGTRMQSIHDNLLGSVSPAAIGDRNFPADIKAAFIADIPEGWGERPYASGNLDAYGRTDALTNAAKAWDYAHGIDRPDYVTHFIGPVDPSGTRIDGTMWFGAGNPSTGYTIGVHDGEGIEFGWNVHYRTGDQIAGHLEDDGLIHFDAPAGAQLAALGHNVQGDNLARSATSLDYAVVTGLNGTSETVSDYEIRVLIDRDPSANTNFKAFTMVAGNAGQNFLLADDGSGGMGDDDGTNPMLSENSMNFGFGFLTNSTTGNTGEIPAGTYDVIANVYDDGVLLFTNHIVLDLYNPFG